MLAQLGLTQNIEIITKAEVVECSHEQDIYKVRIRQNPRYVDPAKCVSCGLCEKKCPVFETPLSPFYDRKRPAIHLPAMNAVPRGYVIDEKACLFFRDGSCRICERVCPKGAVNLQQNAKEMELDCQGIILSPGADSFVPDALERYGYGRLRDVVSNMEFESLLDPGGPTLGKIRRPSDGRTPLSIAWIQCVGSRQLAPVNRPYCSSVCCSAAIKQALTAKQLIEPAPKTDIFFMDIRTHQKGSERFYRNAREKGVNFINSRPHGVCLMDDGSLVIDTYSPSEGRKSRLYDMVVLSTGLFAGKALRDISWKFGLDCDQFGFNQSPGPQVEATTRKRIFASGTFNGPKSIPAAVMEGSAAAALLRSTFGQRAIITTREQEKDQLMRPAPIPLEPTRIGVFVCHCGTNIRSLVDTEQLAKSVAAMAKGVIFGRTLAFSCAPDGAQAIEKAIREEGVNRVVLAACSPRSHETVFQQALKRAGLDPSMLVVANIREQVVWAHQGDPEGAFARALDQITMAVEKARLMVPYEERQYRPQKAALVLGGGISGMTAAALLAESGIRVSLVERSDRLGGNAHALLRTWRGHDVRRLVVDLERRLKNSPLVSVYLDSQLEGIQGTTGNLTSYVKMADSASLKALEHGVLILATGAREARPRGYYYGRHPGVLTHQDLDRLLMEKGVEAMNNARCAVFLQCVESCDSNRPYCSRVCCTHAITRAVHLKERLPNLEIYILYKHMRTYGLRDEYYRKARQLGIKVLRFPEDQPPELELFTSIMENGRPAKRLRLTFFNETLNRDIVLRPDYLFLASAIEPDRENNEHLSALLKLPLGQDGFFQEIHMKLRPCELRRQGFFVAGLAHYPKEVEESMSQAAAAASKALAFLSMDKVTPGGKVAMVRAERCDGCGLCLDVCKEGAISLCQFVFGGEVKYMAEIDDSLCNGCGSCVGVCPKYAVGVPGYMPQEIVAQINVLLRSKNEKN